MRKIFFILSILAFFSVSEIQAQTQKGEQSVLFSGGYQTNHKRFLLGAQYRYVVFDNFRVAPDVMFFFPKKKVTGLDVNLNLHYVINIDNSASFYPLMGYSMQNNRYAGETKYGEKKKSRGWTDSAFNLGAGLECGFSGNMFLNPEIKYMFGDNDCFVFQIGFGLKF